LFFDPTRPLISEEKFYKETNATNSATMPRGSLINTDPFLSNVVCKLIDFDTVTDIGKQRRAAAPRQYYTILSHFYLTFSLFLFL
jgi:hypothetical protein